MFDSQVLTHDDKCVQTSDGNVLVLERCTGLSNQARFVLSAVLALTALLVRRVCFCLRSSSFRSISCRFWRSSRSRSRCSRTPFATSVRRSLVSRVGLVLAHARLGFLQARFPVRRARLAPRVTRATRATRETRAPRATRESLEVRLSGRLLATIVAHALRCCFPRVQSPASPACRASRAFPALRVWSVPRAPLDRAASKVLNALSVCSIAALGRSLR